MATDRGVCGVAVGVEVRRPVVPLDDGDGPAGAYEVGEGRQRVGRAGEVLQYEADEDVIERGRRERECVDVGLPELDVREPGGPDPPLGLGQRRSRNVDRGELSAGATARQRHALGADAAAGLQDRAAVRVRGVPVEKAGESVGLSVQPLVLVVLVSVNVGIAHYFSVDAERWTARPPLADGAEVHTSNVDAAPHQSLERWCRRSACSGGFYVPLLRDGPERGLDFGLTDDLEVISHRERRRSAEVPPALCDRHLAGDG